jgi:Cyclin, N-terminal domain
MPITRSQSRLVIPVTLPPLGQQDMPSPEPPAKRTRSHTKTVRDPGNTTKKPRTSRGNAPKTIVAISPEDTVATRGVTSTISLFGFLDDFSPPRINALVVNDEPLPPGVTDIFAKDLAGGFFTSIIESSPFFWQCESYQQGLLSHLHMTHYGRDYLLLLRLQESREARNLEKVQPTPLRHRNSPLARTRLSPFYSDEEKSNTSDDLSENMDVLDEENDITSDDDESEIRSHNVSRYRPRNDVSNRLPHQPQLTVQMRRVLVQWMSEVVKEFKLSEATYHLAVTLLDELLARGPGSTESSLAANHPTGNTFSVPRNEFQALGWYVVPVECSNVFNKCFASLTFLFCHAALAFGWLQKWKIARLRTFATWNTFPTIP